jgi:hemoglobin
MAEEESLYEGVGGMDFFRQLVDHFYAGVEQDPLLRRMYPEDLDGPRERLSLFLAQYWGGPDDYDQLRGHPRLRMRHMPFPIDTDARDAWLGHMKAALDQAACGPDERARMWAYFEMAADAMVNRGGLSIVGSPPDGR